MPTPNPEAMNFLLTRRSRPARTLTAPVPTRDELMPILTAAARVPDHGKLEPWRFMVLTGDALKRLAKSADLVGQQLGLGDEEKAKGVSAFADAQMIVAIISVPRPTHKIPQLEQWLSGGAVGVSLVNAALASGWGACWLTGWAVEEEAFCDAMGLNDGEWIIGLVHIGTETSEPPDRPRPDIAAMTAWIDS
jgi:nitroreductase